MVLSFQIPTFSPLSILGLTTLTVLSYKVVYFVHLYFLTPSRLSRYLSSSKDEKSWALITGSSDGIGLETARLLYGKGFNIILHGRNPEKLSALAEELRSERPDSDVEIQFVAASATEPEKGTDVVAEHIKTKLNGGRLRVLFNNIGYGIPPNGRIYHFYEESSPAAIQNLINLNAIFPALLTSKLLPVMRHPAGATATEQEDTVPILVVNILSLAGLTGMPYIVSYSSSKAFNSAFSYALTAEMVIKKAPVEVLGIVVGDVFTANNHLTKPSFATLTAKEMATEILNRVGCGVPVVIGSWRQALQMVTMNFIPDFVADSAKRDIMHDRRLKENKII